ncbi:hypothetical protein LTR62_006800 [Meristemomyces frigidus]|uniref:Patatin-like phospholipase domain-containing protein n=1 Tax=Meristemomyces frigidus TaxID=1508187 RepID=A0AAN7TCJ8_9PEZI|nr:hypothetical protein LTR62_006800 [Meristemomyces frigidus]
MFRLIDYDYHRANHAGNVERPVREVKGLRASRSVASLFQPVQTLVRHPLNALGSVAESLGCFAPSRLDGREEEEQLEGLRLKCAKTYDQWYSAAARLDLLQGASEWKTEDGCKDYNVEFVNTRIRELDEAIAGGNVERLRFLVRTSLARNTGGIGGVNVYKHSRTGTKRLVERYIDTTCAAIDALVHRAGEEITDREEAFHLFEDMKKARQTFGRSALLLSGGGTLGMNHIGVVKALFEANILPKVISGASAGSIVCAVLCTKRNHEVPQMLLDFCTGDLDVFEPAREPSSVWAKARKLLHTGAIYDVQNLRRVMEDLIGNITFVEAYNKTRRILNICVSTAKEHDMPRILNYITAPDVMIASAVAASCSVPLIFTPGSLQSKNPETGDVLKNDEDQEGQWIDGSVDNDLPMTRLAEIFNVNHFIVSQVNPHVIPFLTVDDEKENFDRHPDGISRPGEHWLNGITAYAKDETLQRLHVLEELGVFPHLLSKARSILGQKYSGDITILPDVSYTQFPSILTNPTPEFMRRAMLNGERATWPKLARIRNHGRVELKLEWAVKKTMANAAFGPEQLAIRATQLKQSEQAQIPRGRYRRSGRSSHKSVKSLTTSSEVLGALLQSQTSAMVLPTFALHSPSIDTHTAVSTQDPIPSSADEAKSMTSASPTSVTDNEYDSDDEVNGDDGSQTSLSPSSPKGEKWPPPKPSNSEPSTPSVQRRRSLLNGSPPRTPMHRLLAPGLTMTPTPRPITAEVTPSSTPSRAQVTSALAGDAQSSGHPETGSLRESSRFELRLDFSGIPGYGGRQSSG